MKLPDYAPRAALACQDELRRGHRHRDPGRGRGPALPQRSKMHLGLKRNFQVIPGAEWLELLCKHIPEHYEHLVR